MLVLTRRIGEAIVIGDDVEIVILETNGDAIKIGIQAPRSVSIFRKEVYQSIQKSNLEASKPIVPQEMLKALASHKEKQTKNEEKNRDESKKV